MNAVEVENVCFSYGAEDALSGITFGAEEGEFVAVMGPNGSGKSTLMKLILGLLKPTRGKISVFGVDPATERERAQQYIGYMPQRENIAKKIPIEVKDVVLMGLTAKKKRLSFLSRRDVADAREALESVGLTHLWNKKFSELSGGQQQRVMFA
ncbi:MAG: ATP-binding cassette domain-containing protein, partial [Thermoplasmata archaeon]|nr:ATP-binding cassette domain-containing protein [Thermoplasmata archaeon]